jgi:hypothetical protein
VGISADITMKGLGIRGFKEKKGRKLGIASAMMFFSLLECGIEVF